MAAGLSESDARALEFIDGFRGRRSARRDGGQLASDGVVDGEHERSRSTAVALLLPTGG